MLRDQIDKAKTDEKEMMELINKFNPLLKKYAAKLNYEDAYSDILLYFIELIKSFNLNHISCLKDAAAVSYINVSIKNFYCKKLQKIIKMKKEIVLSSLTEEQKYYAEAQLAKEDKEDIFVKVDIQKMLSRNEYRIIYLIYVEGYTAAEIAETSGRTRQAVNQFKHRALRKIKNALADFSF